MSILLQTMPTRGSFVPLPTMRYTMDLTRDPHDDTLAILTLDSDIDEHTAEGLVTAIEELLEAGVRKLIVDCERVEHISSSGLGALIRLDHRLRKRGGAMRIINVQGNPADAMRMTQLDQVFEFDADMSAAREHLEAT